MSAFYPSLLIGIRDFALKQAIFVEKIIRQRGYGFRHCWHSAKVEDAAL